MVFFSSRISPFTSTVIFLDRSPAATALVTSAMFRTCDVKLPAMKFTLSVRSFQVPATPCTSAWPPSLPSVPTSRATRVTSEAKDRSWSTMVLMVFFSSRISPFTSTVIFLDRSPVATALVTSAMFRTCEVRLPAMKFTESVKSFHVPATPCTSAWAPSLPSVPTSRATRVTSEAKDRSWSTIVLMVFFSSRISPFTSTVIFLDRSPAATALVTSAIFRTCDVRLEPIEFTESVKSFQVPATPCTSAWPPSFPSVPTSRATRVTSAEKVLSCCTILLMIIAVRRNSPSSALPSASSAIDLDRSPCATAPITRATSDVGCTRSAINELIDSAQSRHKPLAFGTKARSLSLPSLPTTRDSRVSSCDMRTFSATTSLKASDTLPNTPVQSCGSCAVGMPFFRSVSADRKTRVCSDPSSTSSSKALKTAMSSCQKPASLSSRRRRPARALLELPSIDLRLCEIRPACTLSSLNSAAILPYVPSHSLGSVTLASPRRKAPIAFKMVFNSLSRWSAGGSFASTSMQSPNS